MMRRRKRLLLYAGAVLFLMGLTTGTASAQFYATPNGTGDCMIATPCNLADAVIAATAVTGTVFVILPNVGATVTFQENLEDGQPGPPPFDSAVDADVTFSTSLGTAEGVEGIIAVGGNIIIEVGVTLTIAEFVELRLVGQPGRLVLNDSAAIAGDGFIAFTATGGDHTIILGNPAVFDCVNATPPNRAFIRNVRVEKINGDVKVIDECASDDESNLFITNRLDVEAGMLNMNDNNLWIVDGTGPNARVHIEFGATIQGDDTFFIGVKGADQDGFPNTRVDAFPITGRGMLNMNFDKITDAGVRIELHGLGGGGMSFNRAGALFATEAVTLTGSFLNESLAGDNPTSGARTELDRLNAVTGNLEIKGPGKEVDSTGTGFQNGVCDGNESGVYFFGGVTVQGDVVLDDTDDLDTDDPDGKPCVEGVSFEADELLDDANVSSRFMGTFIADGITGVTLDAASNNRYHNLALEGDVTFDESPIFVLDDPFDAGSLCPDPATGGNRVIFSGNNNRTLAYNVLLDIQSVQVNKPMGRSVEIDSASARFLIDTTLEVVSGTFITNGLLDANSGPVGADGATVVIYSRGSGAGILKGGAVPCAYRSDAPAHTPWKVTYTGMNSLSTGDEIPGPLQCGGVLPVFEVNMDVHNAVVTPNKPVIISQELHRCRGVLDGLHVQFIHNAPDADDIDLYADNVRMLDDFAFQTAVLYLDAPTQQLTSRTMKVTDDAANTLAETTLSFVEGSLNFIAVVGGLRDDNLGLFVREARVVLNDPSVVEATLFQGWPDVASIDVHRLDVNSPNNRISPVVMDLAFGDFSRYLNFGPFNFLMEFESLNPPTSTRFSFDLSPFEGAKITMLTSGQVSNGTTELVAFEANRMMKRQLRAELAMSLAGEDVPDGFTLYGNHPNPFNPSTIITFDLPEPALVTVEVFDLLGRQAMRLPGQRRAAGPRQTVALDASALASGTYLYRVRVRMTHNTEVRTGLMTLIR